jgi:hypothetical protein
MRKVSCSAGNIPELGLLVNSLTWVCLVQPETISSMYLMICAPYETGIFFYRVLHGIGCLRKHSYLGLSCAIWNALVSVLNDLCTGRVWYSVLQGTA